MDVRQKKTVNAKRFFRSRQSLVAKFAVIAGPFPFFCKAEHQRPILRVWNSWGRNKQVRYKSRLPANTEVKKQQLCPRHPPSMPLRELVSLHIQEPQVSGSSSFLCHCPGQCLLGCINFNLSVSSHPSTLYEKEVISKKYFTPYNQNMLCWKILWKEWSLFSITQNIFLSNIFVSSNRWMVSSISAMPWSQDLKYPRSSIIKKKGARFSSCGVSFLASKRRPCSWRDIAVTTILGSIICTCSDILFLKIQSIFIICNLSLGRNKKRQLLLKP